MKSDVTYGSVTPGCSALAAQEASLIAPTNARRWRQRLRFLLGPFRCADVGSMDDTHVVLFDWTTARDMAFHAGVRLSTCASEGGFPWSRFLGPAGPALDAASLRLAPGLVGTQFIPVNTG